MVGLTRAELKWLKEAMSETWPRRYYYGSPTDEEIKPCIRVTNPKDKCSNPIYYKYGNGSLKCYQVAYLIANNSIPSGNIGHGCANVYNTKHTSCIEWTHMFIEDQPENMGRRTCHLKIRKWEKANRKRIKFKIVGAWHLTDIRLQETKMVQKGLKPSPTLKKQKQKQKKQPNERHSKQEMDVDTDSDADDYYKCNCKNEPECFINYNKYKTEYIRKNIQT